MKYAVALLVVILVAFAAAAFPPAETPASTPDPNLQALGAPHGRPLDGAELDAKTEAVGSLVRCPVCQGLSIADSPSPMAVNMKRQTREMLAAGYDEEQILAYFERSYGEFVRLEPPLRGVNWLIWIAPLLLLIGGGTLLARMIRKSHTVASPADDVPSRDALPDEERLAANVLRIREMAYGWPAGRSPRKDND